MKIGVKTYNDKKVLEYFKDKVDFFEVMALQKKDYSFLKSFSLPIVIHAEHHIFGINPADISKKEKNISSINFAIELANFVNAKKIIVHPGAIEKGNKHCSLKNSINFFNKINDDRILIENLALRPNYIQICRTAEQIKEFMGETNTKFCFDVNHYLKNLKKFNGKYDFIKKYIELNPKHYHIGGQKVIKENKDHLCFANSDLDLNEIFKYFPKSAEITLETETDIRKMNDDVKTIRKFMH